MDFSSCSRVGQTPADGLNAIGGNYGRHQSRNRNLKPFSKDFFCRAGNHLR
jgi:hypothetical protein